MTSRRTRPDNESGSLRESWVVSGLEPHLADLLDQLPHRLIEIDPRRPFREHGAPADEAIFVRSGIIAKFKSDSSGRRQIVALRFPGEGVLPGNGPAQHGIQAVIRSEILLAKGRDFDALLDAHPALQRYFLKSLQRNESIGCEWLVNCGRRDSTARVAHLLCETATRMRVDDERMVNPFTQQQIADITGQTSVNVNRVLAEMERHGLIKRHGREIGFVDWPEMRRVASFQAAYLDL